MRINHAMHAREISCFFFLVAPVEYVVDLFSSSQRVMGKRKFHEYLPDQCHRRYSCVHCRAHLANHDELISKVGRPPRAVCTLIVLCLSLRLLFSSDLSDDICHLIRALVFTFSSPSRPQSFQGSQGKAYLFNKV